MFWTANYLKRIMNFHPNCLSGVAEVWKNVLVTVITGYIKIVLRHPNQNLDQRSVLVTVSAGKAATGVYGINCIMHFISLWSHNGNSMGMRSQMTKLSIFWQLNTST